jgi:hypothetical protein
MDASLERLDVQRELITASDWSLETFAKHRCARTTASAPSHVDMWRRNVPNPESQARVNPGHGVNLTLTVVRREDLLVLTLEFRDVLFTPPVGNQPGEVAGAPGAYLIVHFQPQHIAEQAFFQASDKIKQTPAEIGAGQPANPATSEAPLRPGAVQSRLAGPSRLAFTIPVVEKIPYTLVGVLEALGRLPQSVPLVSSFDPASSGCQPLDALLRLFHMPAPPHVAPPADTQTAIEVPYRLLLSPDPFAQWSHALTSVEHGGWAELWHTRLGSHRNADPRIRAVWSPDFDAAKLQDHFSSATPTLNDDPFRSSLDSRDRNEIVHLTSNHYIDGFIPSPVETERMMLTTLGAWLKVQGDWDPPNARRLGPLTVEEWRHDATLGRDQYVRVVYAGYLLPFGHRASLVKVTERKFLFDDSAQPPGFVAYLFQRMFIIVREPVRTYSHRSMPFRTVRFQTRVTPDLADPASSPAGAGGTQSAFWPRVIAPGGAAVDFEFHLVGVDWEGKGSEFTSPLVFVDRTLDASSFGPIVTDYNNALTSQPRRHRTFAGQAVAFAPPGKPRDTSFDTSFVTFGADPRPGETPHFRPIMSQAEVEIPAVNQITGKSAPSVIEWESSYLAAAGNDIGNVAQLFAKVKGTPLDFGSTERTGGLVAPDLTISGLSRSLGPIGGNADKMVTGNFNPKEIFDLDVKLFGAISLSEIIKDLVLKDPANTAQKIPQLVTVRDDDVIRTTYAWRLSGTDLVDTGLFTPKGGATFSLTATVEKHIGTSPPVFRVDGELTNFSVTLLPKPPPPSKDEAKVQLVEISFDSVSFSAQPGKKVDVSVHLADVQFLGILSFVNELRRFIPLDGFSDPPSLVIRGAPNPGVDVGFTLAIPTIGLGIMTMQNVSLSAGVFLPFGDAPLNFHFAFCERDQPFILTVSLFGGGGFFSMDVGIHKVVMIEAALEFGASVAINLGVAQGQASIMAGFYFQKVGDAFVLTGYFRASGSLSVLGIITVSLVFYLGLTYASKGPGIEHAGTLWGQAKLTVKIEILFFSTSVSVSMEREFAGNDPRFRQLVAPSVWTEYCDAFAAYA